MLKNLLYLTVFTTFVVIVWIGLTIYHNISRTTISEIAQIQIVPINSSFNPEAIQNIKERKQVVTDLSKTISVASGEEEVDIVIPTSTASAQSQEIDFLPNEEFQ